MSVARIKNAMVIQKDGENIGRMDISGEVGWDFYGDAWDAGYFNEQLKGLGDVNLIELHINSPGGSVFDGIAIYNALVQHKATIHVYVDGIAASIASVIAMAGDKIYMPSNTMLFIHEPWMYTAGSADELRKDADMLDKNKDAIINSYLRHLKGTSDSISEMMKEETWMTAQEAAIHFNNVTILHQEAEVTASLDIHNLGIKAKLPKQVAAFLEKEEPQDKEGLGAKIVKHLNRKGFAKAAKTVQAELLGLEDSKNQPEANDMTDQEKADLKADIVQASAEAVAGAIPAAVTQSLIDAKAIPDPEAVVVEDAPIAFEGDPNKREDVIAHQAKMAAAAAAKIMASGDSVAIKAHLESLTPKNSATPPTGNFEQNHQPSGDEGDKAQNRKDTGDALMSMMSKG